MVSLKLYNFRYPAWYPIDWRNDISNFLIVYIYQFIGIIFVAYSIILMEAYGIYLMVVAGSHLDILAIRLKTLGHDMTLAQIQNDTLEYTLLEKSFRTEYLQTYAKIAR